MTDTIFELFPSQSAGKFGRRQKRERGSRLPVTIVTGFLGAGKTTLVRRFLETPEGRGTALIVNEFGSEGIDDALLRESSDEVTLLGNDCLCCNTRTDLQVALRKLVADRDRHKIPHFGRVLIETSGLADRRRPELRDAAGHSAGLAGVPPRDGDADHSARARSPAHQGAAQSQGQQRAGGVPGGAAPDPSAGGAFGVAGCRPGEPRGV